MVDISINVIKTTLIKDTPTTSNEVVGILLQFYVNYSHDYYNLTKMTYYDNI